MPNNIELLKAGLKAIVAHPREELFAGSPESGQGLFSDPNIMRAVFGAPKEAPTDLGTIRVSAPAPYNGNIPRIYGNSNASNFAKQKGDIVSAESKQKKDAFKNMLIKLGVPVGSAILGTINPDLLPETAGMVTGYNQGVQRSEDRRDAVNKANETTPTYTFDPDTGDYIETGVRLPKNAEVRNLTSKQINDLQNQLDRIIGVQSNTGDAVKNSEKSLKEFKSEDEARRAGYGTGDRIKINGVSGVLH